VVYNGRRSALIYYIQFLLYDRVNELCGDDNSQPPLQVWWCLPIFFPFNLIVGLIRQLHFLADYFYRKRGVDPPPNDPVADFFPFIKAPRYTWQEFFLTPSLWCRWLQNQPPIERSLLPTFIRELLSIGESNATNQSYACSNCLFAGLPFVGSPPRWTSNLVAVF
jgi:hypothetical protein